jgi:hypothetical protein
MRVLVACEFSGVVRDAFRKRGHDAWSCDLLPSDNGGPHLKGDVLKYLDGVELWPAPNRLTHFDEPTFVKWDLMIAFPPCKYICVGGNNWLNRRPDLKWRENRELAAGFFMSLVNADIGKIAIENPIGVMSSRYRKPDQIIHPYMFGHDVRKDTCLWLKNLPPLMPTLHIPPPHRKIDYWSNKRNPVGRSLKSITYQGIAEAMAEQWGNL